LQLGKLAAARATHLIIPLSLLLVAIYHAIINVIFKYFK